MNRNPRFFKHLAQLRGTRITVRNHFTGGSTANNWAKELDFTLRPESVELEGERIYPTDYDSRRISPRRYPRCPTYRACLRTWLADRIRPKL